MSGLKPIIREAREAVVDAAQHMRDKLPRLTHNIDEHLDDVVRQVKARDKFDDKPDLAGTPTTHRPGTGRSPASPVADTRRHGVDRGDGRDDFGKFVSGDNRQWVDKEKIGLDNVARTHRGELHRVHVRAVIEGRRLDGASADQGRYYDGLIRNADGTYTGIEVKSGTATRNAAQRGFDDAVSVETPAIAMLDEKPIRIVRVILETVP
ncbi:hypothetical protein [Microbacterium sp.]|uniref:hypothetical protein n=1 Tax=Microbacterium sp. TaxID=51671 RepID=UPI0039E2837B